MRANKINLKQDMVVLAERTILMPQKKSDNTMQDALNNRQQEFERESVCFAGQSKNIGNYNDALTLFLNKHIKKEKTDKEKDWINDEGSYDGIADVLTAVGLLSPDSPLRIDTWPDNTTASAFLGMLVDFDQETQQVFTEIHFPGKFAEPNQTAMDFEDLLSFKKDYSDKDFTTSLRIYSDGERTWAKTEVLVTKQILKKINNNPNHLVHVTKFLFQQGFATGEHQVNAYQEERSFIQKLAQQLDSKESLSELYSVKDELAQYLNRFPEKFTPEATNRILFTFDALESSRKLAIMTADIVRRLEDPYLFSLEEVFKIHEKISSFKEDFFEKSPLYKNNSEVKSKVEEAYSQLLKKCQDKKSLLIIATLNSRLSEALEMPRIFNLSKIMENFNHLYQIAEKFPDDSAILQKINSVRDDILMGKLTRLTPADFLRNGSLSRELDSILKSRNLSPAVREKANMLENMGDYVRIMTFKASQINDFKTLNTLNLDMHNDIQQLFPPNIQKKMILILNQVIESLTKKVEFITNIELKIPENKSESDLNNFRESISKEIVDKFSVQTEKEILAIVDKKIAEQSKVIAYVDFIEKSLATADDLSSLQEHKTSITEAVKKDFSSAKQEEILDILKEKITEKTNELTNHEEKIDTMTGPSAAG